MNIAIIGAGMAGLATARALQAAGASVTLFDKGRRPGGRLATRYVDGFMFNHGCQFFTARDAGFQESVRAFSALWPLAGPDRFAGVPDMAAIARGLAAGLTVRSSAHVRALHRTESGWRLLFDHDITAGPFDRVILAIPAPQAAALLAAIAHPFAAALASVHLSPCWALLLGFDEAAAALVGDWPANAPDSPHSPIAWQVLENSRPGAAAAPVSYMLHASAAWSTAHLEDRPEDVIAKLTGASALAAKASYIAVHRWRYALADRPLGEPFLWDAARQIGLCGDWCLGGRLEAAYLSGHALGIRLGT